MAKPSKLDREIAKAQAEFDEASTNMQIAGRVLQALNAAKSSTSESDAAPKVKRGRKPKKGLPVEVTA